MTEIGIAAGLATGIAYLRTGRGPLRLAVAALLHVLAAWRCGRIAAAKAVETYRARYRECFDAVCREVGR